MTDAVVKRAVGSVISILKNKHSLIRKGGTR